MEDYNEIPIIEQPDSINIELYPHQRASIYAMEKLEREKVVDDNGMIRETRLGIIADDTGYGKTLSMIGLISRDKMYWDVEEPYVVESVQSEAAGLINNKKTKRYDKFNATLILVSVSIIGQWKKEFENTNMNVVTIISKNDIENICIENYDVVIITTTMYNNLIINYPKIAWKRFVFDEPGHIRVTGMKELIAGFYWFITATPNSISIQHRNCRGSFIKKILGENWNTFEEQFGAMIIKNNPEFIKKSFAMPETIHVYHVCNQPIAKALSGIVNDIIHLMIIAGDIEGAISALGGKSTDNIISLVREKKIELIKKINIDIEIYSSLKKNESKLDKCINEKQKIEKQIENLEKHFDEMLTENCCICMSDLNEPILEPNCHNLFCGKCLLTWLQTKNKCPLCRSCINVKDLIYLSDKKIIRETTSEYYVTPLQKVIEIIHNNKYGKFIIFSSYDATFSPICKILEESNITYTQLKGNQKSREKNIDDFRNGSTSVIFLNTNSNGTGINLQETTDIIFYHEMPINIQKQIIGRANRIGRKRSLKVHHITVGV